MGHHLAASLSFNVNKLWQRLLRAQYGINHSVTDSAVDNNEVIFDHVTGVTILISTQP